MMSTKNSLKLLPGALLALGLMSATSVWAQAAAPANATVPAVRAEVKAEAKDAVRTGAAPMGEGGVTKEQPKGGALPVGPDAKKGEMTRAEVKTEAKRAAAAGEVPKGEGNVTKDQPKGGAKVAKGSETTRAAVKAEAKRADKAGEIPKGEASMPPAKPL